MAQTSRASEQFDDDGRLSRPIAPKGERRHRATYATDKRKGGYLVRVEGPEANRFVGREVPVTLKSGNEQPEKLERLLWTGTQEGKLVALYTFQSRPREDLNDEIPF